MASQFDYPIDFSSAMADMISPLGGIKRRAEDDSASRTGSDSDSGISSSKRAKLSFEELGKLHHSLKADADIARKHIADLEKQDPQDLKQIEKSKAALTKLEDKIDKILVATIKHKKKVQDAETAEKKRQEKLQAAKKAEEEHQEEKIRKEAEKARKEAEKELDHIKSKLNKAILARAEKKKNLDRAISQSPSERRICCVCGLIPVSPYIMPSGLLIHYECATCLSTIDLHPDFFGADPHLLLILPDLVQEANIRLASFQQRNIQLREQAEQALSASVSVSVSAS